MGQGFTEEIRPVAAGDEGFPYEVLKKAARSA